MASTSTSANVFISHRGVDVKKTLASHLYQRLLSHGIRAFLDQDELVQGDDLTRQIECAIRSASVHVAIFSTRYADSAWCLKELVLMQDSNSPIIPVFYGVEPAELRRTTGTYAQNLEKLKSRHDSPTVEKWGKALASVADIIGFELKAYNGDEGKLLRDLVEQIVKRVKTRALVFEVAKYPTGLGNKIIDFENTVLLQGKPQILGIVGLGGVGKTTLAKEIFNRKNSEYKKSCFLSDVRDNAGKGCLISLQKKLLKSLNVSNEMIERVDDVDEGKWVLRRHLSSVKALVAIDDVDHEDQVHALFPHQTVLESDSLILITSRNKDVLIRSGVEESSIYNLTGLPTQHSLELFCLHSFNKPHPLPEFKSLVDKFVKACGGLPLSLKVFGALLHGKNTGYWKDQLNKLQRILPREIKQRLHISYDALDREEQSIFLDIACFFIGEDKDMAIRIWDGGLCGFQNIQSKCLVEVNSKNKIEMHDQIRDMGREIAKDSGLPRRLWRWTENTTRDLKSSNGPVKVRGIRMVYGDHIDHKDALSCIPMMTGLQLLETEDALLRRILREVQHPDLGWLRLRTHFRRSFLTSSISMENLKVLQVAGDTQTLWENEFQVPLQLRELEVDAPLWNIPESIGKLKHLERIVLQLNDYRSNLTKLPEEFCLLQSLQTLLLNGCKEMKSLPENFRNLTNLRHIDLSGCSRLHTLPDSFGNLTNLRHIDLSWCSRLHTLPDSFGNLTNLRHIDLSGCSKLDTLLNSFDNLTNLTHINLSQCFKLDTLPDSFGNLTHLQHIALSQCSKLDTLPDSFGNLTNLTHINMSCCSELETLPGSFGNLTNLRHINLSHCSELGTLPSSFGKLIKLQHLDLGYCSNLSMSSETLGNISTLQYLNLQCCWEIKVLPPQVVHQRSLEQLRFGGTNIKIKELPSAIGELSNLEVLEIGGPLLDTLPSSLGDLKKLKELRLYGCDQLKCLPVSVGQLTQLTDLSIWACPLMRELSLKKEVKGERETLSDLEESSILLQLQKLYVNDAGISEVSFPEGVCCNLRRLCLQRCNKLRKIQIDGCIALEELQIKDCLELEEFPGIEALVSLRMLNTNGCKKLKSIRGFGQLAKLREVNVGECSELEELEGIQHCMSLKIQTSGCKKLKKSKLKKSM